MIKHHVIVITASEQAWAEAQQSGEYTRSTIDSDLASVGFVHATFPDQTIAMLNRHFIDRDDVVLLLVDTGKVKSPIKHEAALSGRAGTFPHIYGPLNVYAVYDTIKPKRDEDGLFVEPKGWAT
jgi:uncharacterized protein (DUF952 family)